MVDTLHVEVPSKLTWTDEVRHAINSPFASRFLKQRKGAMYEQVSDLRPLGIPALVSCGHKHHPKLGPKVEILRTGDLHYSEWIETLERMFKGEVEGASILRLDLTTDIEGVSVDDMSRAHWARYKRTNQDVGEAYLEPFHRVMKLGAQTMYHGIKPNQIRIYDKTRHRLKVLLPELNKARRRDGLEAMSFEEVYGYDARKVVTRLERQMGDREPERVWNLRYLGDLPVLMKKDPFSQLQFINDTKGKVNLESLDAPTQMLIGLLRDRVGVDGIDWTRDYMRTFYDKPNSFRKFWRQYAHLILSGSGVPSRATLTRQFHKSLRAQLAA